MSDFHTISFLIGLSAGIVGTIIFGLLAISIICNWEDIMMPYWEWQYRRKQKKEKEKNEQNIQ